MASARCAPITASLRTAAVARPMSKFSTEQEFLDQELPDPDFEGAEPSNVAVEGDAFGITASRQTFLRPSNRYLAMPPPFRDMFHDCHPQLVMNPAILRNWSSRFGLPYEEIVGRFAEAGRNPNLFLRDLAEDKGPAIIGPNAYGVVAVEKYDPETFCLLSLSCPSYECTQNEEVLEAIHEVVLSAAEIPVDCPRNAVVDKLMGGEWAVEGGDQCRDVLRAHGIGVVDCVLLPYGDYSAQGFAVADPVHEDFPNIGTSAAATCLDLRTGIHNRFRFHVERIADSVADHVISEAIHFGQPEHILRQSYWFKPSYSVEEFIRFKERLLQPSANIFEMRYTVATHHAFNLRPYRNVVEMEKLQIQQHKFEKNYEEYAGGDTTPTSSGYQASSAMMGMSSGAAFSRRDESLEERTSMWRNTMKDGLHKRNDRLFGHFYSNRFF